MEAMVRLFVTLGALFTVLPGACIDALLSPFRARAKRRRERELRRARFATGFLRTLERSRRGLSGRPPTP